jgi:16S rRNA (guanine527-N7)-methyltransferase
MLHPRFVRMVGCGGGGIRPLLTLLLLFVFLLGAKGFVPAPRPAAPPPPRAPVSASALQHSEGLEHLSPSMLEQIETLSSLLVEANAGVNLISRQDIENVWDRHLLPCLALSRTLQLPAQAKVMDVGTGGGLPGLPMAICFPEAQFLLVDARGKKIAAVRSMASKLGLRNVEAVHARVEDIHDEFDYILGRAVTSLPRFMGWIEKNLRHPNAGTLVDLPSTPARGVFYMRGEASKEEMQELGGLKPRSIVRLADLLGSAAPAGMVSGDRGYSCVFHFHTEDILQHSDFWQ